MNTSVFDEYYAIKNPFGNFDWKIVKADDSNCKEPTICEGELCDFDFSNGKK